MADDHDDIPTLNDVLRPGDDRRRQTGTDKASQPETAQAGLTATEIEAIAARVIERHQAQLEAAVSRAIQQALEKKGGSNSPPESPTKEQQR